MSSIPDYYDICFIGELISKTFLPSSKTVRITGKLQSYCPITGDGTLSDLDKTFKQEIKIDFKNITHVPLTTDSYYQVSGTLGPGEPLTITAEIVRNVDGIDLQMFKESVKLRRQFLTQTKQQ